MVYMASFYLKHIDRSFSSWEYSNIYIHMDEDYTTEYTEQGNET